MTPARATRVAELLRAELAAIVRTQMRDPRVSMLSITDARVSRDLGSADIYVSSLSALDATSTDHVGDHAGDHGKADLVAVLNRAAGFLQSAVARRHDLRKTPKLRFHYDDLIESGPRLEALIDEAVGDSQSQRGQTKESVATTTGEHGP